MLDPQFDQISAFFAGSLARWLADSLAGWLAFFTKIINLCTGQYNSLLK